MIDLRDRIESLAAFAGRSACTDAERRAATWLHDDLRARGHEAFVETIWVRPQWGLSLGLHAALGVAASLVSTAEPIAAAIAAGVLTLSYALEVAGYGGLLRRLFFRRATQIVLVVPADADGVALVITAATDAPRRGLAGGGRWRRLAARAQRFARGRSPGPLAWVAIALAIVTLACVARALGADGPAIGAVQLLPTVALLMALAVAIDAGLSSPGRGVNDCASGVAVALALHDELVADPADRTSVGLVLAGAGSLQPLAWAEYLRRERPQPRETIVVEVGACAMGEPVWATSHPQVAAVALRAGALSWPWRRSTAARAAARRGIPAISIRCIDGSGIAPDVVAADEAAVLAALDWCLAFADELTVELEAIEAGRV